MNKMPSRPRPITLTERGMQIVERRIPALAAKAGHKAYRTAIQQTGAVVVKTSTGQIVKRERDGRTTVIKSLPVGKRVKPGTVLRRTKHG